MRSCSSQDSNWLHEPTTSAEVLGGARSAASLQLHQHLSRDLLQSFKYAVPLKGDRLNDRLVLALKLTGKGLDGEDVGQVALVELQDIRNLAEVVSVFLEIGHEIIQRLGVGVHAFLLRIGDKHDSVHSPQDQFAAGIVKDLAGDGVEMDARLEAAHRTEVQRQKVEEQGALGFGGQRDHFALLLLGGLLVDVLQVGGLPAEARAIVDDLAVDLAGCEVDEAQDFLQTCGHELQQLVR